MVRCPVCGARVSVSRGRDGSLRCPVCSAKLKVKPGSTLLYFLPFLVVVVLIIVTGSFMFFLLPFVIVRFWLTDHPGTVEAIHESTSDQESSSTENLQIESSTHSRRETVPVRNATAPRASPTGRYCIYCGALITEPDSRFCGNCGASTAELNTPRRIDENNVLGEKDSIGNCMVCGLVVHKSEVVAYCIHCGNIAHRLHLLEWIHVKGLCPMCEERLTEKDI
jgi:hypothetical protein